MNGGIGRALQHEFALYPTAKSKSIQEEAGNLLPEPLRNAFDELEKHIARARRKGPVSSF
jgi:hypothetical protein